jgi:hypothetical protein
MQDRWSRVPKARLLPLFVVLPGFSAAALAVNEGTPHAHGDPIAPVILGVTGLLFVALLGRFSSLTPSSSSCTTPHWEAKSATHWSMPVGAVC